MFTLRFRNIFNCNFTVYRELRRLTKVAEKQHYETTNEDVDNSLAIHHHPPEDDLNYWDHGAPRAVADPFKTPALLPTFNLAAYVNQSETLQQLMNLGVDLSSIEKRKGLGNFILKLDFEKDMKEHITFLNDVGVHPDELGKFITTNPLIFKEDLDNLQTRINYLESKKFIPSNIQRIVQKNPFWLMFTTKRIDRRLGYFQQNYKLSGDDVRFLATKQPRLITYQMKVVRDNAFSIKEEMGFTNEEIKSLLLSKPRIWMMKPNVLVERFDLIHREMQISHERIVESAEILYSRQFRIKQRHEYLKFLGRAQYDPTRELYVPLRKLVEGTDEEFATGIAKTSLEDYDMFLRTL